MRMLKDTHMQRVLKLIEEKQLISKGETIGIAVSGGQDSMALLHVLNQLSKTLMFKIFVVNIDHSIRKNSQRDSNFVLDYCKEKQINAKSFIVDAKKIAWENKLSVEMGARKARYEIFEEILKNGTVDKIALAHHKNDQAETILMHLFRGSGISGIKGMEIQKRSYIRPFLNIERNEIEKYVAENKISFVTDETNTESVYQRNFLRNEIFPLIQEKWPNAINSITNFANDAREDDDFINSQIDFSNIVFEKNLAKIPNEEFKKPNTIIARLIFFTLSKMGIQNDIERKHINLLKELALNHESGEKINLPMGLCVIKEYDYITLIKEPFKKKTNYEIKIPFSCGRFDIQNFGFLIISEIKNSELEFSSAQQKIYSFFAQVDAKENEKLKKKEKDNQKKSGIYCTLFLDADKLPQDAIWRMKKNGDVFTKFSGGTKKLNDYLTDIKIPLRLRNNIPVLAVGNIIYVIAGIEISNYLKITKDTKKIFKIEVRD